MNGRVRQMLEDAGFVFWQDEQWSDSQVIDWSCNYDKEIEMFVKMVVDKCVSICEEGLPTQTTSKGAAQRIKHYFEINNI